MIPGQAQQFFEAAAAQSGGGAFQIDRSLRFNQPDSPNLSRTLSSSGDRRTWTLSWWMKLGNLGVTRGLFGMPGTSSGSPQFFTRINTSGRLYAYEYNTGGGYQFIKETDMRLRDPSAWYHCVFQFDSTQSTAEDGFKIYINGTRVTDWNTNNLSGYAQDYEGAWNSNANTGVHKIGLSDQYFDGYFAEIHFVDGTALTASDFGEYDDNNNWNPKQYSGSYGTNGFYLKFDDNSSTAALGTDSSGNGNTWTVNNFSVASGSGNDSLIDSPTNYTAGSGNNGGNYATLNPLDFSSAGSPTLKNGNLDAEAGSGWQTVAATIGNLTSSKWYWEVKLGGGSGHRTGLSSVSRSNASASDLLGSGDIAVNSSDGRVYVDGSAVGTGVGSLSGRTVGIALNLDANSVSFYHNGSLIHTVSSLSSTASWTPVHATRYSVVDNLNFGQRPFAYTPPTDHVSLCTQNLSDSTITDGSTEMDIATYTGNATTDTAITGLNHSPSLLWIKSRSSTQWHFLADIVRGTTENLASNSSDAEETRTNRLLSFDSNGFTIGNNNTVNENSANFVAWSWDAGSSNTTINVGDLNSSFYNQDENWSSTSGVTSASNAFDGSLSTGGVVSSSGSAITITTSSFTATKIRLYKNGNNDATLTKITVNGTDYTFPQQATATGWNEADLGSPTTVTSFTTTWSAGAYTLYAVEVDDKILVDTTASPPDIPAISSTVRANTTSGFSIASWTGNGTSGERLGHGLNATPKMVIFKNRDTASTNWRVYNTMADGSLDFLFLNTTGAKQDSGLTTFTSTTFTAGSSSDTNGNGDAMIAYCFAPVAGYSAFGSYTGNGSADGPFVFTGFRPRWIMIKSSSNGGTGWDWHVYDSERDTYNAMSKFLDPNTNQVEETRSDGANYTDMYVDFVSNGFKLRNSYSSPNNSGSTFIYAAFAEHPFKIARAR